MITLSNWFQVGQIPSNLISGQYDPVLVILSYVVAVLASCVALNLVGRLSAEQNPHAKIYWLAGGAFTMGAGIWSMHFIGMLAFIMPMPMDYELAWTLASLIMAILASALALFILQKHHYSIYQFALGGVIIGLAISTMHYMGMEGMKSHVNIHYVPSLFFLSVVIGITAAEAALFLALQSNQGSSRRQYYLKIISALVMGIAICGMHYTGMAAALFTPIPFHDMPVNEQAIQPNYLAFFIAGITALIISLALTVSNSYKKMIAVVENEKNFLKAMLDNLEDGIIACDAKGRITVLNRTLQNYMNGVADNLVIDDLFDYFSLSTRDHTLLHKEDFPLHRVLRGESVHGVELIMNFTSNTIRDVVMDGQKIVNSDGDILGAVAVVHDITELKRTEKLKNEFVSIVSHELRTPLTSIRGSLGLLVSGVMGEFSEKANKLLEIANNNCERLLLLINDILDIEKIEAGKMDFQIKTYDLNHLISESIAANKMYAEKYGVFIDFIPPESIIQVDVDSSRLMQVLANLLSNACKFSPKGEHITVTMKQIKSTVRVSVTDKGFGIPSEFQSRIFQKFSQADSSDTRGKGGTGLGLNISKTIIEKLGGVLNFESEPGSQTTFYFDLPVTEVKPSPVIANTIDAQSAQRRLLICDDDQDQSEYLRLLLESAGFIADVADSVTRAKQLLAEHQYQALLLDLILPDQDGIAFIRELRAQDRTKDLHIIVISVIAQTGHALLNGDAVSVVDWFDKPIDFNKLLTSINRLKKRNGSTPSLPLILHIEDNIDMQHVVGTLLEQHALVSTAINLQQAKELLDKNDYDLIILDLMLPDGNGIEILPLLAQYHSPVLVFSDMQLNEDYAKYVSQALVKSNSSNEVLLNTIMNLL
ncbi:MHYT domain-containing protein [Legionella bononiensis]|uniref:histidine kinase n=1 Tax=Legionella bononiensis TaxID=2793102 RepID=A0ABS1W6P8_9GAMM|nr:MHYT domain-containing protein [Legionella bononiensis]MBL7478437.1 response regulator [Legionella bononiensis]MBL7525034.1 response regulator [Legionella bononiensis]MBL7561330.1 response regulator [Legionella bononiensis]